MGISLSIGDADLVNIQIGIVSLGPIDAKTFVSYFLTEDGDRYWLGW